MRELGEQADHRFERLERMIDKRTLMESRQQSTAKIKDAIKRETRLLVADLTDSRQFIQELRDEMPYRLWFK